MRLRVVRQAYFGGLLKAVGDVFELRDDLAREALGTGRVVRELPAPPVSGPMTTESVPEIVSGKRKKEQSNVD
jgi:hypothetical protein